MKDKAQITIKLDNKKFSGDKRWFTATERELNENAFIKSGLGFGWEIKVAQEQLRLFTKVEDLIFTYNVFNDRGTIFITVIGDASHLKIKNY